MMNTFIEENPFFIFGYIIILVDILTDGLKNSLESLSTTVKKVVDHSNIMSWMKKELYYDMRPDIADPSW